MLKRFPRLSFGLLFSLFFLLQVSPALAADPILSDGFDQYVMTIGRTPKLSISISNPGPNAIRSTGLRCTSQGTSITASSISRLPGLIAPNTRFETEQYYRAVAPGFTDVTCTFTATDMVTGAAISVTSPVQRVEVLSETRLYFNASSATRVATVGQTIFLMANYGNRATTTFSNVQVSCVELGRSLIFTGFRQTQTTLPPGQSGFAEYRLEAVRPGPAPIACTVTALDTSTNTSVTLPAPTVNIEVR